MQSKLEFGTKQWFEKAYDGASNEIDPWGVSVRAGLQLRLDQYVRFITEQIGKDTLFPWEACLDVGCALGDFPERLFRSRLAKTIIGSDIFLKTLTNAKQRFRSPYYCGMALPNLPLAEKSLDFVSCISVLYYAKPEDQTVFIKEIERTLKPGGYIFLEIPIGESSKASKNMTYQLTSDSFDIIGTGFFYGKYYLYMEGWPFRFARKADLLSRQTGPFRQLWRIIAYIFIKFLKWPFLAKVIIKLCTILKIGQSHTYLLGRRKYA